MKHSKPHRSVVLGKTSAAPRNRTLVLTSDDLELYSRLPQVPDADCADPFAEMVNRVTCGDCLDALSLLDDGCVDLIFADPPYNLGKAFGAGTVRVAKGVFRQWCSAWLTACRRVLKDTGSIYVCCDWRISGMLQELLEEHFHVRNRITWRREKGRGARANWKNNMEDIWFATVSQTYVFNLDDVKIEKQVIAPYREGGKGGTPKDWIQKADGKRVRMTCPPNIWTDLCVPFWSMPENTPHPTQKPEKLVERALRASSNKGDVVLDPFLGSGTTAVVASALKRRWIGIEKNPDFARLCMKRLDKNRSR